MPTFMMRSLMATLTVAMFTMLLLLAYLVSALSGVPETHFEGYPLYTLFVLLIALVVSVALFTGSVVTEFLWQRADTKDVERAN